MNNKELKNKIDNLEVNLLNRTQIFTPQSGTTPIPIKDAINALCRHFNVELIVPKDIVFVVPKEKK